MNYMNAHPSYVNGTNINACGQYQPRHGETCPVPAPAVGGFVQIDAASLSAFPEGATMLIWSVEQQCYIKSFEGPEALAYCLGCESGYACGVYQANTARDAEVRALQEENQRLAEELQLARQAHFQDTHKDPVKMVSITLIVEEDMESLKTLEERARAAEAEVVLLHAKLKGLQDSEGKLRGQTLLLRLTSAASERKNLLQLEEFETHTRTAKEEAAASLSTLMLQLSEAEVREAELNATLQDLKTSFRMKDLASTDAALSSELNEMRRGGAGPKPPRILKKGGRGHRVPLPRAVSSSSSCSSFEILVPLMTFSGGGAPRRRGL